MAHFEHFLQEHFVAIKTEVFGVMAAHQAWNIGTNPDSIAMLLTKFSIDIRELADACIANPVVVVSTIGAARKQDNDLPICHVNSKGQVVVAYPHTNWISQASSDCQGTDDMAFQHGDLGTSAGDWMD